MKPTDTATTAHIGAPDDAVLDLRHLAGRYSAVPILPLPSEISTRFPSPS